MRSRALWHTSGTDRPKVDCAGFARGLQLLTGWRDIEQNDEQGRPGLRDRAVRRVPDEAGQHGARWQAVRSIPTKIGWAPQTLNDWAKKAEVDVPAKP